MDTIRKEIVSEIVQDMAPQYIGGPAVQEYVDEILDNAEDVAELPIHDNAWKAEEQLILNSDSWEHYSEAGNSLFVTREVYERMGFIPPVFYPTYLIYQGIALRQAYVVIQTILENYDPDWYAENYEELFNQW